MAVDVSAAPGHAARVARRRTAIRRYDPERETREIAAGMRGSMVGWSALAAEAVPLLRQELRRQVERNAAGEIVGVADKDWVLRLAREATQQAGFLTAIKLAAEDVGVPMRLIVNVPDYDADDAEVLDVPSRAGGRK